MKNILTAIISLGGLGLIFGILLSLAFKKFAVQTNPLEAKILECLPGSNCGACGFAGCQGFAEALTNMKAEPNSCVAGGQAVAEKISAVLGIDVKQIEDTAAFVACRAGNKQAAKKYIYKGIDNCQAAALLFSGDKACIYGCLGLGSCIGSCPFDAISLTSEGLAVIDSARCKACKKCIKSCPRQLIKMVPRNQEVLIACNNKDRGKKAKEVCSIACIACKICEKACPSQAITMVENNAVIDFSKCNQCGICIEKCPQKTIQKTK